MSISILKGHTVAVCISQPVLALEMPDGFDGQRPPTCTALARSLTAEELAAEAVFVTALPDYVPLLRESGYRGQILTPGVVTSARGRSRAIGPPSRSRNRPACPCAGLIAWLRYQA